MENLAFHIKRFLKVVRCTVLNLGVEGLSWNNQETNRSFRHAVLTADTEPGLLPVTMMSLEHHLEHCSNTCI